MNEQKKNYQLEENQILRKAYYLGHKKVRGKKDPNKEYCFVDLLFVNNVGQPEEYHTITSAFCDVANEPVGIQRLKEVECVFELSADPTRPARFVKVLV